MSDTEILRMLDAFAGSELPDPSAKRPRRRATRRSLLVIAAVVAALALAVPTSFALLGAVFQTPEKFVGDTTQPPNARAAIEDFLASRESKDFDLQGVARVVSAETPDGEIGVYALRFADGVTGLATISTATGGVGAMSWGPSNPCPAGWAVQPLVSFVAYPDRTPAYLAGLVSNAVASVTVLYPDGHAIPGAVANGYFLAWAPPRGEILRAEGLESKTVQLVAYDAAGAAIGELQVGARTGFIPRTPGAPARAPSCG